MRVYFEDTHNVAEGAGAAPLAALLQERERMAGRKVGVILCGGNVDTAVFAEVLAGTDAGSALIASSREGGVSPARASPERARHRGRGAAPRHRRSTRPARGPRSNAPRDRPPGDLS